MTSRYTVAEKINPVQTLQQLRVHTSAYSGRAIAWGNRHLNSLKNVHSVHLYSSSVLIFEGRHILLLLSQFVRHG